jgi:hypothetical protein
VLPLYLAQLSAFTWVPFSRHLHHSKSNTHCPHNTWATPSPLPGATRRPSPTVLKYSYPEGPRYHTRTDALGLVPSRYIHCVSSYSLYGLSQWITGRVSTASVRTAVPVRHVTRIQGASYTQSATHSNSDGTQICPPAGK